MKAFKSIVLTIILSLLANLIIGQQIEIDIIHLTDGSIIKGTITEHIPGQTTKIQTTSGRIFEFEANEVQRITVEIITDPNYREVNIPFAAEESDPAPTNLHTRKPGSGEKESQVKMKRSFIGILNLGYSAPISEADILKGGAYVSILNGGFFFTGGLGLGFNIYGMVNDFDLNPDLDLDPVTFVGISAGPIINMALSPDILLDLRPTIGTSKYEIIGFDFEQIVYGGGASLRFGLSKRLAFSISSDYFYAPFRTSGPGEEIQYASASAGLVIKL